MLLLPQHLEESVNSGLISRHENKGNISYKGGFNFFSVNILILCISFKDPESCPRGGNSKGLKLSPSCDLTKVLRIERPKQTNARKIALGMESSPIGSLFLFLVDFGHQIA